MNKKEIEICEFDENFKQYFLLESPCRQVWKRMWKMFLFGLI